MSFSRAKFVAMALFTALVMVSPTFAQRRVLTNDDVATTPPPAPVAAPEEAPAPRVAPEAASSELPNTPQADLNRVKAIQKALMELYDVIAVKAREAIDPELSKRWTDMNQCMGEVIRANQRTIDELQERLGIPSEAAAPEEPSGN